MNANIDELIAPPLLEGLRRETGRALGLPGHAYYSGEVYELERHRLFGRGWVSLAARSELPNPGDVLPIELAGWPLLLVHGHDGEIRCFHNVCRHRGMCLIDAPAHDLRSIRCPWHAWTYSLDGRLIMTPELGGPGVNEANGFDPEDLGLIAVRIATWFDLIFVDIEGKAPTLDQHLRPLQEKFRPLELDSFRHYRSWQCELEGNWKLVIEGGIEDYHVPWGHPQLCNGLKRYDAGGIHVEGDCYLGVSARYDRVAGRAPDHGHLPRAKGMEGGESTVVYFLNLFPNGIIDISADHVFTAVLYPHGPERTSMRFHHYFVAEDGAMDEGANDARDRLVSVVLGFMEQDKRFIKGVQSRKRLRQDLGLETRFSPYWETAVHAFQKLVAEKLGSCAGDGRQPIGRQGRDDR